VIDEVRKGNARLDESVRQIAESGRLIDVAALIATFARLEREQVFQQIYQGQMQTVLVLCRALDLTWPTLDAILALRAAKQQTRYFSDSAVRRDYEAIDANVALRTIRFLRVRQIATSQAATGEAARQFELHAQVS
jgi:hypothetical protein